VWKRYVEYRTKFDAYCSKQKQAYHEKEYDDEDRGYLLDLWTKGMKANIDTYKSKDLLKVEWQWTPMVDHTVWEDMDELRTGHYSSHVWSPYVIPRAIQLKHFFHCRARYSTIEFGTQWTYRILDFNEFSGSDSTTDIYDDGHTELCSNCYEDEERRVDTIDVSNLNICTVDQLRSTLYGSTSMASKEATCSDQWFLHLLFGSMGTVDPDLAMDLFRNSYGYAWQPDDKLREQFFADKVPVVREESEDDKPTAPKSVYDYCVYTSWLKHRVLEVSNTLGPIERYYKPPTAEYYGFPEDSDSSREEDGEELGWEELLQSHLNSKQQEGTTTRK